MKNRSLANSYLASFCKELAMFSRAGFMPETSVLMMQDDEPDKDGKAVLQSLIDTLEVGEPLSVALEKSKYFPKYMAATMEVGERTGRHTETLDALAEHYDRQDRLAISVKNAVMHPVMLLIVMLVVLVVLIVQVLPIFNNVFARLGSQMSPLAVSLMQFGVWIRSVAAVIAVVMGALAVLSITLWVIPRVRFWLASMFRSYVGVRGIFGRMASLRFISSLSLAIASGLGVEDAVTMASGVSGGVKDIDKRNRACLDLLEEGMTLTEALTMSGIVSASDGRMLSAGSRSGQINEAIAEVARRNDLNIQDEINRIVGRIEPILTLVTSTIVGIILLSVMLPLIGIMTSIG
ncbi:MAG: type II secretion system F family protein [Oscillospiraceae bacterium]|nr:type II secretion system F family protein [Oscillospiraceae bacterium]